MKTCTYRVKPIVNIRSLNEAQSPQKLPTLGLPSDELSTSHKIEVHAERTGEMREFFGSPAERYITRRTETYPQGAEKTNESIAEGWYVNIQHLAVPVSSRRMRIAVNVSLNDQERLVIQRTGELDYSGIPAKVVTTSRLIFRSTEGMVEHTSIHITEMMSLAKIVLDPLLFEVPKDFRKQRILRDPRKILGSWIRNAVALIHHNDDSERRR